MPVVVADGLFAGSKTCSACRRRLEALPLPARDVNAVVNLKNRAVSSTASACGKESAGRRRKTAVKPAAVKQIAD